MQIKNDLWPIIAIVINKDLYIVVSGLWHSDKTPPKDKGWTTEDVTFPMDFGL